jgi:4-amino-4-deoxy-L-arabinose transferase-like glycosyltransferase
MSLAAGESTGVPTAASASPSVRRPTHGASLLISAGAAAAFLTFCVVVQYVSGSWWAGFRAYPDEPAHFVGAVMLRDWLVSGQWFSPLEFAQNYYAHYPFFAVGYWPPLFSIVTGLWMLVAGVGRVQALFIPAVFAAGTAWLIFQFIRLRAGIVAALCAGTLYLSLPVVRHWICAVMVDHMTAFLCIASAACLLRYLKHPVLWNGILCAVISGCAILSKYSAVYVIALPIVAVLFLRRFELLRKPSLLVQPFIIALMVGPWALWTKKLAFYGLPSEREALTAKRAASFVLEAFKIFPPVLMALVVLGLVLGLIALVRPKAWREDIVVLGLLCGGHLAFLILSPVEAEQRYLLVPAAVFLICSFAGWSEVLASISQSERWATLTAGLTAILTLIFVVFQLSHLALTPRDHIASVVGLIVKDPARADQRIVVPPTLEGATIAEFVVQSRHRPDHYLLRPSKAFAHSDWFGLNYSSTYPTPERMMEYFRQHPVNLLIWNVLPESTLVAHARIMSEMLRRYPLSWHKLQLLDFPGSPASSWEIYEYHSPPEKLE